MKKFLSQLAIIVGIINTPLAFAYTGVCTPTGGTHIFNYNASYDIKNIKDDAAGSEIDDIFKYSVGGAYEATCDSGPTYSGTFIKTGSNLPIYRVSSNITWYKLNDYLAVSIKGYVAGEVRKYFNVPFLESNNCNQTQCSPTIWASGGRGAVSLMVIKPFIGFSPIDTILNYTQASTNKGTVTAGPYMSEVIMHASITVPQSCELNTGQTITMDFGNIGASAFTQAGAGNKPAGVNPQTRNIAIHCKNIDAQALLSLRIEANKVSGNAIISDNPDLGFIVADGNKNPLTPNNTDSKIPFQLDDKSSASVPFSAWPVSVTGNKPAEGKFTSEGYLRVDFD